ncbi:hypothetical protein L1049_003135 [Liquidambar formosana]|uniref:Uncharacterized protein n=1 Tax=Liquidambar formosana TaxID=63359 RepID=A0AAP0R9C1_LIQFO
MESHKSQQDMIRGLNTPLLTPPSNPSHISPASLLFSKISLPNSFYSTQFAPNIGNLQYPDSTLVQDQSMLRAFLEKYGSNMQQNSKAEFSQETGQSGDMNTDISSVVSNHDMGQRSFEDQDGPSTSAGPVDLDCLWSY